VLKGDNASTGSINTVTLTAGQTVVIGPEAPPGGYEASSTPAPVLEASMQDTNVPEQPVNVGKHGHTARNVWIGIGLAAGLGVGLGIAETRGGSSTASKCGPTGVC
jgi:hypothetical protein